MFSIFKKVPSVISPYRCDFGSQLLPEADTGPSSVSEAVAILKVMESMGITHCITVVTIGSHNAQTHSPEAIAGWLGHLRSEAIKAGISLQLDVAGRYLLDTGFETLLTSRTLLPLPGNRLLLDNSTGVKGGPMHKLLFEIQMAGFKPVMAQVELYTRYHRNSARIMQLQRCGCELQVEILSLMGCRGLSKQLWSRWLVRNGHAKLAGLGVKTENETKKAARFLATPSGQSILSKTVSILQ